MQIPPPTLSNHLLIASLQLFVWLFLRPSAWHRYVTQIDPQLPPDFALAHLQRHQWHSPQLWHLLRLICGIYPLWSGIIIGMVVGITTFSADAILLGVSHGMALTLVGNLMGALMIAVPFALIASMIGGILLGISVGISGDLSSHLVTIIIGIFVLSMAANINNTLSSEAERSYTLAQQIGNILLGGIFTVFALFLVSHLATFIAKQLLEFLLPRLDNALIIFDLAYAILVSLFLVVFLSTILKLHGYSWYKSIFWSGLISIVSGALVTLILHVETNRVLVGVATGTMIGIWASLLFAFPYLFTKRLTSNWAGIISGVLVSASVYLFFYDLTNNSSLWTTINASVLQDSNFLIIPLKEFTNIYILKFLKFIFLIIYLIFLGLTWCWWQAILLYPLVSVWNLLLYWREQRRIQATHSLFTWHSVCWDERQYLHLIGLKRYLITLSQHYPPEGQVAIAYVNTTRQQWAAQAAQFELNAQGLPADIDNPYIVAMPLPKQHKMFVGRDDIRKRIEQFLYKSLFPPLLLYGQRRMGKTSLLYNLTDLLPNTIVPVFVDMQGAISQTRDEVGFFYQLHREIQYRVKQNNYTLPSLSYELNREPFINFIEWLDKVEVILENKKLLLMLDEFEALNQAFVDKRLNESMILGFFRHLIQHRSSLKILFSGSHTLEEFKQWASYLINVQTLHLSYLKETEAQCLIKPSITDFNLTYTAEASQRVVELTRCHPCLVQMLCSEIVMLKNEQPAKTRWTAQIADIEAAIPKVLNSGKLFFNDIEENQIYASSLAVLHFLAAQGEGAIVNQVQLAANFPEQLDASLQNLLQRELIEIVEDGGYRIQVELIRRWFTKY
jgi:hypothetical protein